MKRSLSLASGIAFVLLAGVLHGQTLWPGTTAGMSVGQVQRMLPDAHEPEKAIDLPAGRGTELLDLDSIVIADRKFKVRFFFKQEQLVNVTLVATGEIDEKEFETFRDLLRAKYDREYSTTSGMGIEVKWKAVQTVILLTWAPPGHEQGSGTLAISYEAPIPKETDRL